MLQDVTALISVNNNDSTCLVRAIVTAFANLKLERWTKTQLQYGFNKSRKLQQVQAMKLHEDAVVEVNDYGNNLNDVKLFAECLETEINIIDSEQFNTLIFTVNKAEDKIYLHKTKNHFDVIESMTAFTESPYYCHECKKKQRRNETSASVPQSASAVSQLQMIRSVRVTK